MNKRDADIRYGLGLHNPDDLDRWREEGEKLERERQRAVAERTESESLVQMRADMWAELEAIRAEMTAQQEILSGAVGQVSETVGQVLEENAESAVTCIERAVKKVHNELFGLIERRFGELSGRLDALMGSGSKARSEKIRSASEPADLPNPLRRAGLN